MSIKGELRAIMFKNNHMAIETRGEFTWDNLKQTFAEVLADIVLRDEEEEGLSRGLGLQLLGEMNARAMAVIERRYDEKVDGEVKDLEKSFSMNHREG